MGREKLQTQTKRFIVQFKKCIHCGQLILRKISKIGATRCQILRLKGTKSDPAGEAYSAPPDSLAVFKGPTSKERGGRRKGNGKGEKRERGREGKGRGLEGPPFRVGIGPPEGLTRH